MSIRKSDIADAVGSSDGDTFVIGESIMARLASFTVIGRITRISQIGMATFIHLEEAGWVAQTDRFTETVLNGKLHEFEPVRTMRISVLAIVDVYPWDNPLPRTQIGGGKASGITVKD